MHPRSSCAYKQKNVVLAIATLCWSCGVSAQAVISADSTSTVNLDPLPDPATLATVTVNPGVTVNVSTGPAVFGQNKSWTLVNDGTLNTTDGGAYAVVLQNGVAVNNSLGGTISGAGGGINAINSATQIINRGMISSGNNAYGVYMQAGGGLQNMQGASINGGTAGLYLKNSSDQVVNHGTISASNGVGVQLEGGNVRLRNDTTGTISGTTYGVQMVNGAQDVVNLGQISASAGIGVDFSAGGTLVNAQGAVIQGSVGGVRTVNGAAHITTAGTISGGTYSVNFTTGGGTLTMQTGALLQGDALGGNTSSIILEGSGTASNNFLQFGSLDMVGSEWTLLGRTEASTSTVSNGRLIIGAPGHTGAVLFANTVDVRSGAELVGYDSTIHGAVTNHGKFYVGSGYAFPGGAAPTTVHIDGSYDNLGTTILSKGPPFGNTLSISGSYAGPGGKLVLGALLDDPYLGPIANQVADRMLIFGAAAGPTQVTVLTRTDTQAAALASSSSPPANAYSTGTGFVVSATEGVSLIQVAGASTVGAFTMDREYVSGGTPYQFKLLAFGPGSPNGPASPGQNLVGFPNSYWDYRLERVYLTAVPLPPGIITIFPPGGGGGGGGADPDPPGRWLVVPQVPGYVSLPGAMLDAGLQDLDGLRRRLGEIRDSNDASGHSRDNETFARVYGSTSHYQTNVSFERYGYNADQNYVAAQFGGSAVLNKYENATLRLGGALSIGHSRLAPIARDGSSVTQTDTQNLSAIATYLHRDGWYVDGILSAGLLQAGTKTAAFGGKVASFHGNSYAASVEVGYPFALGGSGYVFEPQLQYVWQRVHFNNFTDGDGIATSLGSHTQNIVRVGGRLTRDVYTADGTRVKPYLKAEYLKGHNGDNPATIGGINFPTGKYGEVWRMGGGVNGMLTKRLSLFADVAYQSRIGSTGWQGWQFNGGLRYMFGG